MEEREEYKKKNLKLMTCYFFALISVQIAGLLYVLFFPSVLGVLLTALFLGTIWPILAYFLVARVVFKIGRRGNSEKA